jgi:hypothetical protein
MVSKVLRFVRLPFLLLVIYTVARFALGANGVPYAPRGNAMFSILGASVISSFLFGAMSKRLGGWGAAALTGLSIGLFGQILIFIATWLSFAMGIETSYFRHWDALNVPEGTIVPMGAAMMTRVQGLFISPIVSIVAALIGRACSALAPEPGA